MVRYGNYGTLGLSYIISCQLLPHFIGDSANAEEKWGNVGQTRSAKKFVVLLGLDIGTNFTI